MMAKRRRSGEAWTAEELAEIVTREIDKRARSGYRWGMFRRTPPQRPLFAVENRLEAAKRGRLERSWAHAYRRDALPLIDEERFAKYFDEGNGRPNKSVRLVMSVLVLKEVFNLTDAEALEQLEWNTAWHYALDLLPEEAHTCQKTLHNFRVKLLGDDQGAGFFESTTARLIEKAGLSTRRQRQDSTHILPCIKLLTRLGLFVSTITKFLEALRKAHPRLCAEVCEEILGRYLDREGYFADARSSEAPRRLADAAVDTYWLVARFGEHRDVSKMESFALLRRLYDDQCVPPDTDTPDKIELRELPSSSSLQSPSDPDVTYGHKGKGYEVQLTETCEEGNAFQAITAVAVNNANESDQQQVIPQLEQTERTCGAAPEALHADCGYGSGENLVAAKEHGTELYAPIGAKASEGVTLSDFEVSADGDVVRCPVGEAPIAHETTHGGKVRLAVFAGERCAACPLIDGCPTRTRGDDRVLRFTAPEAAVARRRAEQETPAFKERHKIRSGIEATNSELKRCHGLGKLRVRRRGRVALSVRLKALALNVKRFVRHVASTTASAPLVPACQC
jgi:transposase